MKEEEFKINEQNRFGERRNSTAKKQYIYKYIYTYVYIEREKGKHHREHK